MASSEIDHDKIEWMVRRLTHQIEEPQGEQEQSLRSSYGDEVYERKQLEAALALLSKETAEHLAVDPREDARLFSEAYASAINNVSGRYERNQVRRPLDDTNLPSGVIEKTVRDELTSKYYARTLSDPEIVHEWTTKPGEKLTEELAERFQDTICGDVYESYREQRFGKVDLPVLIATNVLSDGFNPDSFWVPISVCFSMVVAQRGLDQFCDE